MMIDVKHFCLECEYKINFERFCVVIFMIQPRKIGMFSMVVSENKAKKKCMDIYYYVVYSIGVWIRL